MRSELFSHNNPGWLFFSSFSFLHEYTQFPEAALYDDTITVQLMEHVLV